MWDPHLDYFYTRNKETGLQTGEITSQVKADSAAVLCSREGGRYHTTWPPGSPSGGSHWLWLATCTRPWASAHVPEPVPAAAVPSGVCRPAVGACSLVRPTCTKNREEVCLRRAVTWVRASVVTAGESQAPVALISLGGSQGCRMPPAPYTSAEGFLKPWAVDMD